MSGAAPGEGLRAGIARGISIVGHPVVLISIAAMIGASAHGASPGQMRILVNLLAIFAVVVFGFSWFQVRSGRWAHVDASARAERPMLNGFLVTVLLGGAVLLWFLQRERQIAAALAVSAALILAAIVLSRWVKMSLHTAFAAFATALLWPAVGPVIAGVLVTAAVAWSRLVLRRHVVADVVVGVLLGAAAGCVFNAWIV